MARGDQLQRTASRGVGEDDQTSVAASAMAAGSASRCGQTGGILPSVCTAADASVRTAATTTHVNDHAISDADVKRASERGPLDSTIVLRAAAASADHGEADLRTDNGCKRGLRDTNRRGHHRHTLAYALTLAIAGLAGATARSGGDIGVYTARRLATTIDGAWLAVVTDVQRSRRAGAGGTHVAKAPVSALPSTSACVAAPST